MPALGAPVTVTTRDYTGPATIVGRAGPAHTGIVSSYRIETPDGQRLRVGPGEVEEVRP
jgi:hypothetical protein